MVNTLVFTHQTLLGTPVHLYNQAIVQSAKRVPDSQADMGQPFQVIFTSTSGIRGEIGDFNSGTIAGAR